MGIQERKFHRKFGKNIFHMYDTVSTKGAAKKSAAKARRKGTRHPMLARIVKYKDAYVVYRC